ncbi:MAG: hypothetical protein CBE26_00265 [Kiritimatiellaceae bacterium TMED266]|nr:MAG: hypothetical protein CBE26_00265 [Kiritimatiellaceae bacterium TMED266]
MRLKQVGCCLIVVGCQLWAVAELRLPSLFSDGMVLQRNKPVVIWGSSEPAEEVRVSFGGQDALTKADKEGRFRVVLHAMEASADPRVLRVEAGDESRVISNVLVGEVWLCSGQSNMQWPVSTSNNFKEEQAAATYPEIRMFLTDFTFALEPQEQVKGKWAVTTPQTVPGFSAVGYFFGRELHKELDVPVGLIRSAWGGTPIEAWSPMASLMQFPAVVDNITSRKLQAETFDTEAVNQKNQADLAAWKEAAAEANKQGEKPPRRPFWKHHPVLSQHYPANLYNAMIHPHVPFSMRGAIWYQGEANTHSIESAQLYRALLENMTESWRSAWDDSFSFYAVQLVNFMKPVEMAVQDSGWAHIRQSFLDFHKEVEGAAIVVGIDVGEADDIHPRDKQTVGYRLAQQALVNDYGFNRVAGGPIYESMEIKKGRVVLRFSDTGSGLIAQDGESLRWFAISGEDQQFVKAKAEIVGETVVVSHPDIKEPKAVRYAWANNPEGCNLYNKEGFPASPFRTDDW